MRATPDDSSPFPARAGYSADSRSMRRGCDTMFGYRAGHGIERLEEDLAMSDRMPEPENAGDQRGSERDLSDTAEFAKLRAVMRASEKHREGGVDPELEDGDADPGPDT